MISVGRASPRRHRPLSGREDDARFEIWLGVAVVIAFFVILLGWAAFIPLDAAAYARGEVTVASHLQEVQHREGGVIRRIDVKDGQYVQAGDVLIELVGADVVAAHASLLSQVVGLEAEQARLQAEQASAPAITWPATLTTLLGADRVEAGKAMSLQQTEFRDLASDLASHKAVLRQRMSELSEEISGYQRQSDAAVAQQRLVADQLKDVKSLADQGYAPMSQVRSLERDNADLDGRRGEYAAQISQAQQQIGELQLQILQLDADQRDQVSKDLRDLQFQLNELQPKLTEADDQLARTQVRAPTSGTVVGLSVFTVGGVIGPGQKLLDVVPDKSQLVIEAQISPADVEGVHVGQITEVRLGAERDRTLPILKGALTELSADSLVNPRTGGRYFAAQVTIPPDQLALLKTSEVKDFEVRPGLPAQVVIPVARRTALQFLLEPLTKTLWRSGRER